MKLTYLLISVLSLLVGVNSFKILLIQHFPSYSHYIIANRLARALVDNGHEVTLLSPFKWKTDVKNLTEIVVTGVAEGFEEEKKSLVKRMRSSTFEKLIMMVKFLTQESEKVLQHQNTKQLFEPGVKFDLVMMTKMGEEVFTGFSYLFHCPYIILSTVGSIRWSDQQAGNPTGPSYVPEIVGYYSYDMSFLERTINTLLWVLGTLIDNFYRYPKLDKLLQQHFPGAPPLTDLYYNASLYLLNSHPSYSPSLPRVPNMIDVGGLHVEDPKPLPDDLRSFLDGATEGAIYFSMGSNVKGTFIPSERREAILRTFSKLKQKVLWKFEDADLPNKPPNVRIAKWFPQQDILAHPNIKLFITHGGLLSTIEAVYHSVPLIGIPVMADQRLNVMQSVKDGYALTISFDDINEEDLTWAIKEILSNPKYRNNIKERSQIFHDRPMKPISAAVYWIEYVVRHRGATHLRSITTKQTWYQLTLLDVIGFLSLCTYIVIKILIFVIRTPCWGKKRGNKEEKSKRD